MGCKVNKRTFFISTLLLFAIITCLFLPGMLSAMLSSLSVFFIAIIGKNASIKGDAKPVGFVMAIPVFLAAVQNIYLGVGVSHQTSLSLQILLSLHFLLILLVVISNCNLIVKESKAIFVIISIMSLQSMILYLVYPSPITSAVSALRNVLSCSLVYLYTFSLCKKCEAKTFYYSVEIIAWFVVIFGFIEYISGLEVWQRLGITQLWNLKGISTNIVGVPLNWYSSERIAGNQIKRMVSSFADPVNLGTFLFAAFMIAWLKKKKVLMLFLAICCVLTISKGALLGFLIFMVVLFWYKDKSKVTIPIVLLISAVISVSFIQYSLLSSTGSVLAHIRGFLNSCRVLLTNPLGLGIGNVGVLAGLFSSNLSNTAVTETGIGVVMAQLGWIGLICYISFFCVLFKMPSRWKRINTDKAIVYYTLLFSFVANAMFNEVALSPNSCALYFIELAVLNREMSS